MARYVVLPKDKFNQFVQDLTKENKVVAPISKGYNNFSFDYVDKGEQIALQYIPTIIPPKKYIFPSKEALIEYDKEGYFFKSVFDYEKLILFGIHTCDLAGIHCLNMVFSDQIKDINYIARKNKIIVIGLECNDYCDENALCSVMNTFLPNGGYDLFFTEFDDYFLVQVATLEGEALVKKVDSFIPANVIHLKELEKLRETKHVKFKQELNIRHEDIKSLLEKSFYSKIWDNLDKRCLSCGNCTNVCPTCYCFDILDDISLNFNNGEKYRKWDSCQNEEFTEVAGGEIFRKKRGFRQRHRFMRKFQYPLEKYNRYFCVGCGRCSRTCMAKINLKETLNDLVKEQE